VAAAELSTVLFPSSIAKRRSSSAKVTIASFPPPGLNIGFTENWPTSSGRSTGSCGCSSAGSGSATDVKEKFRNGLVTRNFLQAFASLPALFSGKNASGQTASLC
jgi:hypothetical protein